MLIQYDLKFWVHKVNKELLREVGAKGCFPIDFSKTETLSVTTCIAPPVAFKKKPLAGWLRFSDPEALLSFDAVLFRCFPLFEVGF